MAAFQSDALVFFGATGDLAYKQIFPSIQALIRDEGLNVPIVGVAKSGWSIDQLRARAKDSLEHHGGVDQEAFKKLIELLRYVDGDYADGGTFSMVRKELGSAKQPLHYLAIPPSLFGTVAAELAKSGCADNARVVIEKPFGHDLASARQLCRDSVVATWAGLTCGRGRAGAADRAECRAGRCRASGSSARGGIRRRPRAGRGASIRGIR